MKQRTVFAFIMGAITTGLITFTAVVVNMGFIQGFLAIWLKTWIVSYIVAVPLIIFVAPKVQHLVNKLFSSN